MLLEWTAKNPAAATYDGDAPRELMRWHRPFVNHNGGQLGFNPTARRGSADYGLLYAGNADGGAGGDPMNMAQNLASTFGKILRIDPLGKNSANGKYGIPKDNPFVNDNDPNTLGEIYAYGARNPQRFAWDSKTRTMYMADIGQGIDEEVTTVPKGANLGWRVWEGSHRFVNGSEVSLESPRSDPKVTYPVVEFGQLDPLLQNSSAVTMGYVYRHNRLKALRNLLLFGDNPVRRDVLRQRRQAAAERRPGCDPSHRLQRQGADEDAAGPGEGEDGGAGKETADARRPSVRRRPGRADLHPQQVGWSDSGNRELEARNEERKRKDE